MKTLRVLSGGAAQGLVEALRARFEAASGCRIEATFGAVGAMRARLLAGEPADLMILSRTLIDALARDGHVAAASVRDIGTVETAVAVRRGDAIPPIATADQLRRALLASDAIHFPDPEHATAGIHFADVMRRLGVTEMLAPRLRPAPNGATAMRALAVSTSDRPLGCTQATEILYTPGVVLAAMLPREFELATTYSAAVCTKAAAPDLAARFVEWMCGERSAPLRVAGGFEG